MDPQDPIYDDNNLRRAMEHFTDSTTYGKLYLNYPMLESYKHLKEPFDPEYISRRISIDYLRNES